MLFVRFCQGGILQLSDRRRMSQYYVILLLLTRFWISIKRQCLGLYTHKLNSECEWAHSNGFDMLIQSKGWSLQTQQWLQSHRDKILAYSDLQSSDTNRRGQHNTYHPTGRTELGIVKCVWDFNSINCTINRDQGRICTSPIHHLLLVNIGVSITPTF
jgi:hypothetical protein